MNYWAIPEDITHNWASVISDDLMRATRQHAGELVRISVTVKYGLVTGVISPEFHRIEPRNGRVTISRSQTWWSVVRRLRSVAPQNDPAVITTWVLIGQDGMPVLWCNPQVIFITNLQGKG